MRYIADANTFLAVALDEPEKPWLVDVTNRCELAAPVVLPYEIGNALSALARRTIIPPGQAAAVWDLIATVPVELLDLDIREALVLAARCGCYAYDAYYLQCALETRCPLLTLDQGLKRIARELSIRLVEPT